MKVPFLALDDFPGLPAEVLGRIFQTTLARGQFIGGPELDQFESEFAQYCQAGNCVGTGNGLDAMHLVLWAFGIGPGDEVLVPSNTFIATWLAVSRVGATPVPVEPDLATFNMDPDRARDAITPRTKAILAVDLYGLPAPMRELGEIAAARGLFLIADAAQSHGASIRGSKTGSLADATAFSFYPTKNLGALGDGGAVVTSSDTLARKVRGLANYGASRKNVHEMIGANSRLDSLQAAVLREKLKHLDSWNERRAQLADFYLTQLRGSDLILPRVPEGYGHAWHLFVVRSRHRDALRSHLSSLGVEALVHYPTAPHLQEAYAHLGIRRGALPVAELLQDQVLSLPMHPGMTDEQARCVVEACRSFRPD